MARSNLIECAHCGEAVHESKIALAYGGVPMCADCYRQQFEDFVDEANEGESE